MIRIVCVLVTSAIYVRGVGRAAPCESVCLGLSCDTPATCAVVEEEFGCVCAGCVECSHGRRLFSSSCPSTCLGGETCNSTVYDVLGMSCADMEDNDLWADSTCDCGGCDCPNRREMGTFSTSCASFEEPVLATSAGFVSVISSSVGCAEFQLSSNVEIGTELKVVSGAVVKLDGRARRLEATNENRLFLVSQNASLELSDVTLQGGYSTFWGGCVAVGAGASLTTMNVVLTRCASVFDGGAVGAFKGSTLSLVNTVISNSIAGNLVRIFAAITVVLPVSALCREAALSPGSTRTQL